MITDVASKKLGNICLLFPYWKTISLHLKQTM